MEKIEAEQLFDILKIEIIPEVSDIWQPVDISIKYTVRRQVPDVKWSLRYIIDAAGKRKIIELGSLKASYLGSNPYETVLRIPAIDVKDLTEKELKNIGLLNIKAEMEITEMLDINMLVKVSKRPGVLEKCIMNPLE